MAERKNCVVVADAIAGLGRMLPLKMRLEMCLRGTPQERTFGDCDEGLTIVFRPESVNVLWWEETERTSISAPIGMRLFCEALLAHVRVRFI